MIIHHRMISFASEMDFSAFCIFNPLSCFAETIFKLFLHSIAFCLNHCTSGTSFTHTMAVSFHVLVLFKRKNRIFITELLVELMRIEITLNLTFSNLHISGIIHSEKIKVFRQESINGNNFSTYGK